MSQVNITVAEFIDMYSDIIGYNSDSQCSYDLINKGRIIAYASGDWVGTVSYERILVNGCNFMLPSKFETIKRAKNASGIDINVEGLLDIGAFNECCEDIIVRISKRTYLPFQLTENIPLWFWAVNSKDVGTELRVAYMDNAGSLNDEILPLLHQKPTRLINVPLSIHRISKKVTVGMVGVEQCGVNKDYIPANEKTPTYNVYSSNLADCSIIAEVKHKFIPYTVNDENAVLDINPEALSSLIAAVQLKDKKKDNWIPQYAASVKLATDFLKAELKNETSTSFGFKPVNTDDRFFNSLEQP